MKLKAKTTISEHFSAIKDPRLERTKLHQLIDIITITICAVISGAESWDDLEDFGHCKYDWLKSFLKLPNGIPSHDTFNRVFARINPQELEKCFSDWVKSISNLLPGSQIAIDGKTLRHSYDNNSEQKAIVMVSAWARESRLVLAQRKVSKKSNEITAVPELLKVLELSGAIVTIDAIGCQTKIVNQIVNQKADYLITLKKNQSGLYKRVDELFNLALSDHKNEHLSSKYTVCESAHGRIEQRQYHVLNDIRELVDSSKKWSNFNSAVRVEYSRQLKNGKSKLESRYFITSLSQDAKQLAEYIRGHHLHRKSTTLGIRCRF
ncbi:putative H repeat-associated protein [Hyella patelloides LEGE 07179]|uniref:Putative H repeat-associated protein n=1 Tax=Hyella patelloides LEGE 07179 TaxID=945734 RepID=A0A563VYV9_9CYAN|nr:putative H repeat-associated protein [Hyella patelloides LEGE 07179]